MMAHKITLSVICLTGLVLVNSGYTIDAPSDELFQFANENYDFQKIELPSSIVSEFEVKVKESDLNSLSDDQCYQSSAVKLYDILWKIEIYKNDSDVKISLVSVFEDTLSSSSCLADGKSLLLNNEGEKYKDKEFEKETFSNYRTKIELFSDKWSDLTSNCLKDGVLTLKFTELNVQRPVQSLQQTSTKFQLKIFNVEKKEGTISLPVVLRGVRWQVWAFPYENHLGVFVKGNVYDMAVNYGYTVHADIKLWSNKKEHQTAFQYKFHWRSALSGAIHFIKMDELTNEENGYVFAKNALLEVKLTVNEPELLS